MNVSVPSVPAVPAPAPILTYRNPFPYRTGAYTYDGHGVKPWGVIALGVNQVAGVASAETPDEQASGAVPGNAAGAVTPGNRAGANTPGGRVIMTTEHGGQVTI